MWVTHSGPHPSPRDDQSRAYIWRWDGEFINETKYLMMFSRAEAYQPKWRSSEEAKLYCEDTQGNTPEEAIEKETAYIVRERMGLS